MVGRELVERVARVLGPASAAARALAEAAAWGGPVSFLRAVASIIVAKHPKQ